VGSGSLAPAARVWHAVRKLGIGHMMSVAASNYDTSQMFVGLVIISVIGVILTELFNRLEHHFDRWRPAPVAGPRTVRASGRQASTVR
jgi:hypothetical protein